MYVYEFTFDISADAKKYGEPEVQILDFDYGGSNIFGTRPNILPPKPPIYSHYVVLETPRPDFLYVKWVIISTGLICEKRVPLQELLPKDITNYQVHFFISKTQLYIYAFPPFITIDNAGRAEQHMGQDKSQRGTEYNEIPYNRKFQIFPAAIK